MARRCGFLCVLFSCLLLAESINIGQEENPSLQKLLRSEKDPQERTHPTEVRRRGAAELEVEVGSDGELLIEDTELDAVLSHGLNGCGWGDWSSWSQCSSSCGEGTIKRSRAVESKEGGDVIFAVKNTELYKQSVSLMSPTSSWLKVQQDDMALESIAISGSIIYAISADQKLYKQHLSNLTIASWLAVSTDRSWSQILPYRDALYGISQNSIFKATGGNMTEWSPAAWGEQWKQLAIGDSGEGTVYGLSTEGKLYQQALIGMSTETSWQQASERAFLQVAASGGKIYGVSTDNRIYMQSEGASSSSSWSQAASGSTWTSVLLSGGMLYALSADEKLSRRAVDGSMNSWTTAFDQGVLGQSMKDFPVHLGP